MCSLIGQPAACRYVTEMVLKHAGRSSAVEFETYTMLGRRRFQVSFHKEEVEGIWGKGCVVVVLFGKAQSGCLGAGTAGWFVCLFVGWLVGWLVGVLVGWLVGLVCL